MRLKIMDHTGHSVIDLNDDAAGVQEAERKFRELTGLGFTATVPTGNGEHNIIREFDKDAEEMLFIPRLQGG